MKYKYIKWHNNYDLVINEVYNGTQYSKDYILINDNKGNEFLCRYECFEEE